MDTSKFTNSKLSLKEMFIKIDSLNSSYIDDIDDRFFKELEKESNINSSENDDGDDDKEFSIKIEEIDEKYIIDDGFLGTISFDDNELKILENVLSIDTSLIQTNEEMMSNMYEILLSDMKTMFDKIKENNFPFNDENYKLLKNIKTQNDIYVSARNVLVNFKKSVLEYLEFVNKHKDEILSDVKEESDFIIKKYIEETSKEFDIEYEENSLMHYILAVGLKRGIKNIENTSIFNIIKTLFNKFDSDGYDESFEKEVLKSMKSTKYLISNISNTDFYKKTITSEERDLISLVTSIVMRLKKVSPITNDLNEDCLNLFGSPRTIFMLFLFKLGSIYNKKCLYDFKQEKRRLIKKAKKVKNPILTDDFIKGRISLLFLENYIKKWFSLSLFGDEKILNKKESFNSIVSEIDNKFKSSELISGIINCFSYNIVLNEVQKIINYINLLDTNKFKTNIKSLNLLKGYTLFIQYHTKTENHTSYDLQNLYLAYFNEIINKLNEIMKGKLKNDKFN